MLQNRKYNDKLSNIYTWKDRIPMQTFKYFYSQRLNPTTKIETLKFLEGNARYFIFINLCKFNWNVTVFLDSAYYSHDAYTIFRRDLCISYELYTFPNV